MSLIIGLISLFFSVVAIVIIVSPYSEAKAEKYILLW